MKDRQERVPGRWHVILAWVGFILALVGVWYLQRIHIATNLNGMPYMLFPYGALVVCLAVAIWSTIWFKKARRKHEPHETHEGANLTTES